jgi:endonuclease YncB( thermonuclease family)
MRMMRPGRRPALQWMKWGVRCGWGPWQPVGVTGIGPSAVASRAGILRWILGGWLLAWPVIAVAQQTRDAANPQGKWEVLAKCRLTTDTVTDGDSFHVTHQGRSYIFRLYFVDAPEADATLTERAKDQAAYFGVAAKDIPKGGQMAAKFAQEKLAGREFTVVTRYQNALGRSSLARFYGVVLVDGKNLAEEMVANGQARIYGLRANWPDGDRSATFINKLKNLELAAREKRLGMWNAKDFPRASSPGPAAVPKGKIVKGSGEVVDLNEATFEDLQRLPRIGPKLAELIIAGRPYHKVEDVLRVSGIGPETLKGLQTLVKVEGVEGEK